MLKNKFGMLKVVALALTVLMLAVLGYTLYNYSAGRFGNTELMVYLVVLILPLMEYNGKTLQRPCGVLPH